ncbi:MAG TPA: trimethylamine methyltransferase family protein, partial [Anaerolineales bacterium]|nr:trimethylamine methyltransferase family protein [Anaerolineales bacterium]
WGAAQSPGPDETPRDSRAGALTYCPQHATMPDAAWEHLMRPVLRLLADDLVQRILDEAFQLLVDPGVRIHNAEALEILAGAGARVDGGAQIASIPESVVRQALATAPGSFELYDLDGRAAVHYGGDHVQFDPGSAAISLLDSHSLQQRPPLTADFVRFVQLVEMLPSIDAQSTAMICADVAGEIGDLYRLYLALNYMRKPIITGAFRKDTWWTMKELLSAVAGGDEALAARPTAVFDVCPSPPLLWSDLTCQNLIDCARSMIPAELISMPLAGATAPVTLAGAVVQHTAESLSGVTIGQLARAGSPIVWGGSPAIFDMRHGTTPMGDVGTWMIDLAYVQVGKALGLPTHAYLGMSDAKIVDAQAGLESAGGTLLAALGGVNMVSGAGMLDFESCQSLEKLVVDAEIIGMAKRLIGGLQAREDPIALTLMRELRHQADYLAQEHTLRWFQEEFYLPSDVIDRGSLDAWQSKGSLSAFERARERAERLIAAYVPPARDPRLKDELREIATRAARTFGMDELPPLPEE